MLLEEPVFTVPATTSFTELIAAAGTISSSAILKFADTGVPNAMPELGALKVKVAVSVPSFMTASSKTLKFKVPVVWPLNMVTVAGKVAPARSAAVAVPESETVTV